MKNGNKKQNKNSDYKSQRCMGAKLSPQTEWQMSEKMRTTNQFGWVTKAKWYANNGSFHLLPSDSDKFQNSNITIHSNLKPDKDSEHTHTHTDTDLKLEWIFVCNIYEHLHSTDPWRNYRLSTILWSERLDRFELNILVKFDGEAFVYSIFMYVLCSMFNVHYCYYHRCCSNYMFNVHYDCSRLVSEVWIGYDKEGVSDNR